MKTKVRSIRNYMDIPFEPAADIVTSGEIHSDVEAEIYKELMAHKVYKPVDKAEAGDIADLRLASDNVRFQKGSIRVNIGLGLFSKELEESVIGKRAGESYTADVCGSAVRVTVLALERRIAAVLDDSFVRLLGIDGVTDVEGYREHLEKRFIEFYREAYVEYHALDLFEEMMDSSDISFCDEDISAFLYPFGGGEAIADPFDSNGSGDEIDAELEAAEAEEDAWFLLKLYLADSIARGIDYSRNEELPADTKSITALRDRVIAPIMRYIDDKVKIEVIEDE